MLQKFSQHYLQVLSHFEKTKALLSNDRRHLVKQFRSLRSKFYRALWERTAANQGLSFEEIGWEYYRIRKGEQATFVHLSDVMLDNHLSLRIAGNKPFTYHLLREAGFRVPRHCEFTLASLAKAYSFFEQINTSVVVKPGRDTGAGSGITTNIKSLSEVKKAALIASSVTKNLIIEEQIKGSSFRLLYLNGQFIDAVRRDPPQVIGNGKSTVQELIEAENQRRLTSHNIIALSPLMVDEECRQHLRENQRDHNYVPNNQEVVIVKTVINQNASEQNHSVYADVHPSIIEQGAKAAAVLNIQLAGIDLLTPDITRPLEETGGIIGEINTTPGLHHHYLISEPNSIKPVTEMIMDYIFKNQV